MEVNFLGTNSVVQAALSAGVERFVDFSTSEVYGAFVHNAKESEPTALGSVGEARWVYAASKLASEHLSYAHHLESGLPLAIVRPFNVYGPRQVGDGAVRGIILQALKNEPIVLYNDGTQIRAWCFVDDFVDGVLALRREAGSGRAGVQSRQPAGHDHQPRADADMILRLTESQSEIVFRPHPGAEIELRVPSIHKAAAMLGFAPTVSLEAGITRTIAWYAENLAGSERGVQQADAASSSPGASGFIGRNVLAARAARVGDRRDLPSTRGDFRGFVDARAARRTCAPVRCDLTNADGRARRCAAVGRPGRRRCISRRTAIPAASARDPLRDLRLEHAWRC